MTSGVTICGQQTPWLRGCAGPCTSLGMYIDRIFQVSMFTEVWAHAGKRPQEAKKQVAQFAQQKWREEEEEKIVE